MFVNKTLKVLVVKNGQQSLEVTVYLQVALTCRFRKVIRELIFSGREKFHNSFYFKVLCIV